jgi:glycosyltransferase involved in cell wall biosynthesis
VVTSRFFGTAVAHMRHAKVIVTHLGMHPKSWRYARELRKPLVVVVHNDMDGTRQHMQQFPPDLAVWNTEWVRDSLVRGRFVGDEDCWLESIPTMVEPPGLVVHPPVMLDEYRTTPGDMVTLINHNADKGGRHFQAIAARMPERRFLAQTGSHGPQVCVPAANLEVAPGTMNIRDDVYARTRVLLMPSVYESYGRTAVEAMASGIPVIANPTPGLREAIGPGGIFVDRDDLDGWVAAIRALDDPETYAAASKAALARADELDPTDDLDRWLTAVTQLI